MSRLHPHPVLDRIHKQYRKTGNDQDKQRYLEEIGKEYPEDFVKDNARAIADFYPNWYQAQEQPVQEFKSLRMKYRQKSLKKKGVSSQLPTNREGAKVRQPKIGMGIEIRSHEDYDNHRKLPNKSKEVQDALKRYEEGEVNRLFSHEITPRQIGEAGRYGGEKKVYDPREDPNSSKWDLDVEAYDLAAREVPHELDEQPDLPKGQNYYLGDSKRRPNDKDYLEVDSQAMTNAGKSMKTKTMSYLNSNQGGALVKPAQQGTKLNLARNKPSVGVLGNRMPKNPLAKESPTLAAIYRNRTYVPPKQIKGKSLSKLDDYLEKMLDGPSSLSSNKPTPLPRRRMNKAPHPEPVKTLNPIGPTEPGMVNPTQTNDIKSIKGKSAYTLPNPKIDTRKRYTEVQEDRLLNKKVRKQDIPITVPMGKSIPGDLQWLSEEGKEKEHNNLSPTMTKAIKALLVEMKSMNRKAHPNPRRTADSDKAVRARLIQINPQLANIENLNNLESGVQFAADITPLDTKHERYIYDINPHLIPTEEGYEDIHPN